MLPAISALLVLLVATLFAGNFGEVLAQSPDGTGGVYENMDPLLEEIATQYAMGTLSAKAATQAPVHNEESVGVIFLTESGAADDLRDYLLENGASPGPAFEGHLGADVPVSLLADASQQEGVNWMHASIPPRASESAADDWARLRTAWMYGMPAD